MWAFISENDLFWICVFSVPVAGIIAGAVSGAMANWRKVKVSEHRAALKQSMIERGMSADEIERVLQAGEPVKRAKAE